MTDTSGKLEAGSGLPASGKQEAGNEQPASPLTKAQAAASVVNMLHEVADRVAGPEGDHDALISILRVLQAKPGVRTTEFWVSLGLNGIGFGFQFWPGHESIGAAIMLCASSVYVLSRTAVKVSETKAEAVKVASSYAEAPKT